MERGGLCGCWRPYRGHRDQTKVTGGQIQEHRDQRGEKGLRSIFGECLSAGGVEGGSFLKNILKG